MKVKLKQSDELKDIAQDLEWVHSFLSEDKVYEVFAVFCTPRSNWFTVVNDAKTPMHYISAYFRVVQFDIPSDWVVNSTEEYPVMMGPSFAVKTDENADDFLNFRGSQNDNLMWYLKHTKEIDLS